jgi:hypothetical protein
MGRRRRKGKRGGVVSRDNKNGLNRSRDGVVVVEEDGVREVVAEVAEGLVGLPGDTAVRIHFRLAVPHPH